jgi:hypothetical protein
MSVLSLALDDLKSSKIRTLATNTLTGIRSVGGGLSEENKDEDGSNWIVKTIDGLKRINSWGNSVSGFLANALGITAKVSVTWIVHQIVGLGRFVWNFNWNATDAELDAQYAAYKIMLMGQLGGTIGNAIGWAVCGAGPGLIMLKFNKLLALRILKEVGEEALDELVANLRVLVQQGAQLAMRQTLITTYKSGRRLLKELLTDPNGVGGKFAKSLGIDQNRVKKWGEKGNKPWSFAIGLENWLETIKDPGWQNLTEELIEEFFDACSEAFYVVANAADQYMMEQKLAKDSLLGDQELVEIQPNRDNDKERIIIAGPAELIKPTIVQTLTQHQLLEERDLGMWVGEPLREALIAPPISIQMRVILTDLSGVWTGRKRVQITIPDVRRERIDWERLKAAIGGQNGYMWGSYRCKARLSGGNFMELYAATEAEGVDRLNELAYFTNQEILGITAVRELREGKRKTLDALYKNPTRIYPYGFTVINQQKVLNEESGRAQMSGIYKKKKTSMILLHTSTRPDDFSEIIQDLFYIPGPND